MRISDFFSSYVLVCVRVCACMCVCVCVPVCYCMYERVGVHAYERKCVLMWILGNVWSYVSWRVCGYVYVCGYVCVFVQVCVFACVCM